jgi:hypothetical protein
MYKVQGNFSKNKDNYNTTKECWGDILQFINKDTKLWLPFFNDGTAKIYLDEMGYKNVIHKNEDFFTYDISDALVIDNPPWSIKKDVINKLYQQKRPFALCLPLDTMERKYILKYKEGFQLVMPNKRHRLESKYKHLAKNPSPPFKCCWFCWNMEEILKTKDKIIWL